MDTVQNFILNIDGNGNSCSLPCSSVNKVWFNGHKVICLQRAAQPSPPDASSYSRLQHEPWHVASQTDCLSGEEVGESGCNLLAARATRGDQSCSGSRWCWMSRAVLPGCSDSTLSTGSCFCQSSPGGLPETHSCPPFAHPPFQPVGHCTGNLITARLAQGKVHRKVYLKVAACLPCGWNPPCNPSLTFSPSASACSEAAHSVQQHL